MPQVGFISQSGELHSFDEALALCAEGSDEYPYPYPLLKGMVDATQQRGDYISATSLLHCLRADYLKRRIDYYISVEAAYPMFRGTLFHSLLEANPNPNGRIEEKALRKYKGIELGGTFDSLIVYKDGDEYVLQDWKTTKALPRYGAYSSHVEQINIYRWLNKLPLEKTRMEIHYFTMEGHKVCPLKTGGPRSKSQYWTDQQVEAFLDKTLVPLAASIKAEMPIPYSFVTEEQKWECQYCPVRQQCANIADIERENAWRKRAGLPTLSVMDNLPAPEAE